MQKIDFKNLPDTSTPLNASNLNTMQTNIENAINRNSKISQASSNNSNITSTTATEINSNIHIDNFTCNTGKVLISTQLAMYVSSSVGYIDVIFTNTTTEQTYTTTAGSTNIQDTAGEYVNFIALYDLPVGTYNIRLYGRIQTTGQTLYIKNYNTTRLLVMEI